ncbi:MAG: phosphoribosyl-ATP diphosphatase [Candidatus Hydrogenedentota bacterium]|nr:MAG: phosphoribosyl-ATP diphosphatase [Candidatus Hydrogenedentota bacterium]
MDNIKFLAQLELIIIDRLKNDPEGSYTASLAKKGIDKVLQKVGEEAVEYIIDAKNKNKERTLSEAADLLYHFLVSLQVQGLSLEDVVSVLEKRHLK